MQSKLLTSALGLLLLGTSAVAMADHGRRHGDHRAEHYSRYDRGWHDYGPRHYRPHPHWGHHKWHHHKWQHYKWKHHKWHHRHHHGWYHHDWHGRRGPGWHRPHYGHGGKYYGGYDDGLTIIFKGRID